jgi:hypothetical protein
MIALLLSCSLLAGIGPQAADQDTLRITDVTWNQTADGRSKMRYKSVVEMTRSALRIIPVSINKKNPLQRESPTVAFTDIVDVTADTGNQSSLNLGFGVTTSGSNHWLRIRTAKDYYLIRFNDSGKYQMFVAELEMRAGVAVKAAGR